MKRSFAVAVIGLSALVMFAGCKKDDMVDAPLTKAPGPPPPIPSDVKQLSPSAAGGGGASTTTKEKL